VASFKEKIKDIFKRIHGLSEIGLANSVSALISGIFWLVIANLFGTKNYGEISYLFAVGYLTFMVAFFGAKHHIMVYTAKEEKSQPSVYLFAIITGIIASIILFSIAKNFDVNM